MLGIDPGTTESGYIIYEGLPPYQCGVVENQIMLEIVKNWPGQIACEMIASYGMAVGKEVFETCVWIGRFKQAYQFPDQMKMIFRKDVKIHFCHSMRAKDSHIRRAIIDLFPSSGGGSCKQIGTKSLPGPLYGISSHVWPALAVAILAEKS